MAFGSLLGIASGTEIVGPPRPVRLLSAPFFVSLDNTGWRGLSPAGRRPPRGGSGGRRVTRKRARDSPIFWLFQEKKTLSSLWHNLFALIQLGSFLSLPRFRSIRSLPMQGKEESQQANCFVPSLPLSFFTPSLSLPSGIGFRGSLSAAAAALLTIWSQGRAEEKGVGVVPPRRSLFSGPRPLRRRRHHRPSF